MRRAVWLGVLLLAGCGSPPTHYFVLQAIPPDRAPPSACQSAPLRIDRPTLPASLDRSGIVTAGGPAELHVSGQDRWAAPLDGLVQRALVQDLRARLPGATVLAPGDPAPRNTESISLNITRFLPGAAGDTRLDADWSLLDAKSHPILLRTETLRTGPTANAATGMSKAVALLADRIASGMPCHAAP